MAKKKKTITITQIQYQLVEVYNRIEVSLDELEELIDSNDEDEVFDELYGRFNDADDIIYHANPDEIYNQDYDGRLEERIIPYNEFSYYMGNIIQIGNKCISYHMDERIITGDMKTDIHDFSKMKMDTLPNYVKSKRRIDSINDIIK